MVNARFVAVRAAEIASVMRSIAPSEASSVQELSGAEMAGQILWTLSHAGDTSQVALVTVVPDGIGVARWRLRNGGGSEQVGDLRTVGAADMASEEIAWNIFELGVAYYAEISANYRSQGDDVVAQTMESCSSALIADLLEWRRRRETQPALDVAQLPHRYQATAGVMSFQQAPWLHRAPQQNQSAFGGTAPQHTMPTPPAQYPAAWQATNSYAPPVRQPGMAQTDLPPHNVTLAITGLILSCAGYLLSSTWLFLIALVGLGLSIGAIINARAAKPRQGWKAGLTMGIIGVVAAGAGLLLALGILTGYGP